MLDLKVTCISSYESHFSFSYSALWKPQPIELNQFFKEHNSAQCQEQEEQVVWSWQGAEGSHGRLWRVRYLEFPKSGSRNLGEMRRMKAKVWFLRNPVWLSNLIQGYLKIAFALSHGFQGQHYEAVTQSQQCGKASHARVDNLCQHCSCMKLTARLGSVHAKVSSHAAPKSTSSKRLRMTVKIQNSQSEQYPLHLPLCAVKPHWNLWCRDKWEVTFHSFPSCS
jgi:hypothetical protein